MVLSQIRKVRLPAIPWFMFLLTTIFYLYEYCLRIVPNVLTNYMQMNYHLSLSQIGIVSASYYYTYTPLQLFVGALIDRFGVRFMLTQSVLICVVGNLFFSSSHIWSLVVGRLLLGTGSAFAFIAALKVAADWLPKPLFAMASGLITTGGKLGAIGSSILMAYWTQQMGPDLLLRYFSLFGIGLTICCWFSLHSKHNCYSSTSQSLSIISRIKQTMKKTEIWIIGVIGALLYIPITLIADLWGVPFLTKAKSISLVEASSCISMLYLGFACCAPLLGFMLRKKTQLLHILFLASITSAFLVLIFIVFSSKMSIWQISTLCFLLGGVTSSQILVFVTAKDLVPNSLTATTVSFVNMLVMLIGIAQPIIAWVYDYIQSFDTIIEDVLCYQIALSPLPFMILTASCMCFFLKKRATVVNFD